jgi:hypothetical protein
MSPRFIKSATRVAVSLTCCLKASKRLWDDIAVYLLEEKGKGKGEREEGEGGGGKEEGGGGGGEEEEEEEETEEMEEHK